MKHTLSLFLLFVAGGNYLFSQANICGIRLGPTTSVAAFANGQNVSIEFDYEVAEIGGVRIFVRPFTNGELSPYYAASGSPIYAGNGTGSASFTISTGEALVDEIRLAVLNSAQTTVLQEMWVPVSYYFGENGIHNFQFSSNPKLSSFLTGENFTINFNYAINRPGGARIFIRPYTNGTLSPNYGASGSPVYENVGTGAANFTIATGKNVRVDSLRVHITDASVSQTLWEFFLPVNLYFSSVKVNEISVLGSDYAPNGSNRTVQYSYSTSLTGVRIFPRPWTSKGLTQNHSACASPLLTGSGTETCDFTINFTNERVDHIRFLVMDSAQTEVLLEMYYPTDITFGQIQIHDLRFCPGGPVRLENESQVVMHFSVKNNTGANIRIFPRPISEETLSPNYSASGSPSYITGNSSSTANYTISSGEVRVNYIRFLITNEDQSVELGRFFFPVHHVFRGTTTAVDPMLSSTGFKAFPNPFRETTRLEFTPLRQEQVQVSLYDLMGRKLGILADRQVKVGELEQFEVRPAALGLSRGLYVAVIKGDTFSHSVRLMYE